jgi:prostasin
LTPNVAAHCVESIPSAWRLVSVRLGEWNLETDNDCDARNTCIPAPVSIKVVKTIVHHNYRSRASNKHDDIALLRLKKPAGFADVVSPICLPLDPSQWNKTYDGLSFTAAGWGKNKEFLISKNKTIKKIHFRQD